MLLNPKTADFSHLDTFSQTVMKHTVEFFEKKGKQKLKKDHFDRIWYEDFLNFVKESKIFTSLLTPPAYSPQNPDARWDTYRNCDFNEILGFYGLAYWYTWQVSILGLGPIWMRSKFMVLRAEFAIYFERQARRCLCTAMRSRIILLN